MQSQKQQNDLCSFPRQTIQYHSIQVYVSTINAKEAKVEWFYEDLQDLLELTPTKDMLFIIGDWNAKVGGQEILGVTGKFGLEIQNEAEQRLTGSSLVAQMAKHLPTMQETRFDPWVEKIPWRRKWQPTPVFLSGESHGQRSLAGYNHGVAKSRT